MKKVLMLPAYGNSSLVYTERKENWLATKKCCVQGKRQRPSVMKFPLLQAKYPPCFYNISEHDTIRL